MKVIPTVLAVAVFVAGIAAQGVSREVVEIDYAEPTTDLSRLLSFSEAVIVGQVIASVQEIGRIGDVPQPKFRHAVRVIDVIKSQEALVPGATIDIIQAGGTGRIGDKEVTVRDAQFPVFRVNSKYVFILKLRRGVYSSYAGPATVFPIVDDARVVIPKAAEHVTELRQHNADTPEVFVALLRSRAQAGRGGR